MFKWWENHVIWNLLVIRDLPRLAETHWDSLRLAETRWDLLRLAETHWDSLRRAETGPLRALQNYIYLLPFRILTKQCINVSDVCWLRLDFEQNTINGPSGTTETSALGPCVDSFTVTVSVLLWSTKNETGLKICY